MSYHYVTVTGKYMEMDGVTPKSGRVEFYVDAPIVDTVNKVTLAPSAMNLTLDVKLGTFTTGTNPLISMDNAGLSAFNWWFIPRIEGVPNTPQQLSVLFTAGATQDITSL